MLFLGTPLPANGTPDPLVAYSVRVTDSWSSGAVLELDLTNLTDHALEDWTLEFSVDALIAGLWNGEIVDVEENRYTVGPAEWNTTLAPGAMFTIGFQVEPETDTVSDLTFNGIPGVEDDDSGQPTFESILTAADLFHRRAESEGAIGVADGYFSTSGNQIVDAEGRPVRLAGVSWFGLESDVLAPHGLWTRNYREMMDQMVELGFNTIRLPYCNQLFDPGETPSSINYSLNPDLEGKVGVELIDAIVDYAGQIGLRILLDHHRSDAGIGALGKELWYTDEYPESRWIADWEMLAQRYQGNPTVIGADLHNEPHGPATWGDGNVATDWRLAAERAAQAIHAIEPGWLIVVEGVATYQGESYWWGGNLQGARDHPVRIAAPDKLVYSPHAYPPTIYNQPWFNDPDYPANLPEIWDRMWGYIFYEEIAPVLLGEWGSFFEDPADLAWMDTMAAYLVGDPTGAGAPSILPEGHHGISWIWWSWNPNSGDTGGILQSDWNTPVAAKLDFLAPLQFDFGDPGAGIPVADGPLATLAMELSEPLSEEVTVHWSTREESARAGIDFSPATSDVVIPAGTTSASIELQILPGDADSPDPARFFVDLSLADGTTEDVVLGRQTVTITLLGGPVPDAPDPVVAAWEAWRESGFSPEDLENPDISGPQADPTRSGWSNLLRFAVGLDPYQEIPASAKPVILGDAPDGGPLRFRFQSAYEDLLRVEYSQDLRDWSAADWAEVSREPHGDAEWITLEIPPGLNPPIFIQLVTDSDAP